MAIERDVLIEHLKSQFPGSVSHRAGQLVDFFAQSTDEQMAQIQNGAEGLADSLQVVKDSIDAHSAELAEKIEQLRDL